MVSLEMGPRPEQEQTAEPQPEEEGSPLKTRESGEEKRLNPEKITTEEENRLGGILQTLGQKTKARVAAVLFMAMTTGALAGFHYEATAAAKKESAKTEQVEREKGISVFAPYFRDAEMVLADKNAMRQLKAAHESRYRPGDAEPYMREEAKVKLAGDRKLPWLAEINEGEQEVLLEHHIAFRPEVFSKLDMRNVKEEKVQFLVLPKGGTWPLSVTVNRLFPTPGGENVSEYYTFGRPQYRDNPTFYADATKLLKPEFATRTTPDGKSTEFIRPFDAVEFVTRTGIDRQTLIPLTKQHTPEKIAEMLATTVSKKADERLALLRLQEVAEAANIPKMAEAVQNLLEQEERDVLQEFFKK